MKKGRKIVVLLLAVCLLVSVFAGCNSKSSGEQSQQAASTTAAPAGVAKKEPVALKFMLNSHQPIKLDDPIMQEFQKKANVKLEVELPPQANYTEKVRLLFASGEKLPDAIQLSITSSEFAQARDSELVVPITKYFNESKNLKAFVDPRSVKAYTLDKEIWGVPRNSWYYSQGLYIREDWLKKVGIDIGLEGKAITLQKLEEICQAFTTKDPDGNGQNDTYGFNMPAATTWQGVMPLSILSAFDAGKGIMKDSSGKYVNTNLTTEWANYKKAILYYKTLFDKKLVEPDILIANSEVLRDKWYKGKFGAVASFGSSQSYVNFIGPLRQVSPQAELVWVNSLIGPDGKYKQYRGGANDIGGTMVTKDCKDPKAVIDVLDYMATPEGWRLISSGLEGTHYTLENNIPMRKTAEQKKTYDDYRTWYYTFLLLRDYKTGDWFNDAPNYEPAMAKRVQTFMDISASDLAFNEDLGYRPPAADKLQDMDKEFFQVITKFLLGTETEANLDNMRNKYINSDAFKQWEKELNDWYKTKE